MIWLAPDRFDVKPDKSTWLEMGACMRNLGWDVTILTARTSSGRAGLTERLSDLVECVDVVDLPFTFRVSLLQSMVRWLSLNGRTDDVIVMNEDGLWILPQLRRLGFQFVHLDFRTLPINIHRWKRWLDWLLSWRIAVGMFGGKVDGYSFITERLRREVEAEFKLNATDYIIWQSGVSLERFSQAQSKRANQDAGFTLFYHGSISHKRGLGTVIDAIAIGGLPEGFEFVIVGEGPDRAELQQHANDLGLAKQVIFRGFVPYERIVDEIATADVCICPLPDRLEWNVSSPLKVFEYMACAKPMILTPIPAHLDTLRASHFVVWTHGFEPEDFHRSIVDALSRQSELVAAALSAPSIVRGRYEWQVQAEHLHQYFTRRYRDPSNRSLETQTHAFTRGNGAAS